MRDDDPVSRGAEPAIEHLNADHDDALLDMARALGSCPEATSARCVGADRSGLDLVARTSAGERDLRVPYDQPIDGPAGLRKATVRLAERARNLLGDDSARAGLSAGRAEQAPPPG